ncbi:MAG: helix-turn-helix domain-containing protein [Verrucomicrobiales bacterium]|jgi:AraC-like DNA-binding protein|nr:helix-turn-helix domain-containing protein [Verrucomicrobiales bacterium]HQZ27135.1 helix-turn-helix domain-containing protein [Verrucomicrobiales bacterium]
MHSVYQFDPAREPFSPYGFSCQSWKPTLMAKPDRHNEIELNYLPTGSVTYLLGGERVTVGRGNLALFWAAIPHQIVEWEGCNGYFVATLPMSWFLSAGWSDKFCQSILKGAVICDEGKHAGDETRFRQWVSDLDSGIETRKRAALLELQARILRMTSTSQENRQAGSSGLNLSAADRLACYIARNYAQPLTAAQIASENNLHANYAMTLFRKTFGTTMTDFITQHRISHAQRLLLTTDAAVMDVAMDAGFGSLSRFNEAFKKACGCSPRDYRKGHLLS